MTQQNPTFTISGYIDQLDNVNKLTEVGNKHPLRALIRDATTSATRWYSTFDKTTQSLFIQGGQGSGPWQVLYEERTNNGYVNLTIMSAQMSQPAQPVQPAPNPAAPPPTYEQPPVQQFQSPPPPPVIHWADVLDDKGKAIIRQVAFKGAIDIVAPHADIAASKPVSVTAEWVNQLTDMFEDIILCRYQPPLPPTDDQFVQQEF